jgi:hypothetical protein
MQMKTIYTTLFTLILTINVIAQKDYHKYSLYFNAGLPIQTNFDFKPTIGSLGEVGLKVKLIKGLSLSAEASSVFFKKQINFNYIVANYFTQINAGGLLLMYEFKLQSNLFLGIGAGYNMGLFSGRVFSPYEAIYYEQTGTLNRKITGTVSTIKGVFNIRKPISKYFDAQMGVSYGQTNSELLDMYSSLKNKKADTYFIGYLGLVINLDAKKFGGMSNKGSRRLGCPNF